MQMHRINVTLCVGCHTILHPDSQRCGSAMTLWGSGFLTIKIKSPNFSKNIYSISLISKSKILLIFKSEPKP